MPHHFEWVISVSKSTPVPKPRWEIFLFEELQPGWSALSLNSERPVPESSSIGKGPAHASFTGNWLEGPLVSWDTLAASLVKLGIRCSGMPFGW